MLSIQANVYENPFVSVYLHDVDDVKEGGFYRFMFCGAELGGCAVRINDMLFLQLCDPFRARLLHDGHWKAVSVEGGCDG